MISRYLSFCNKIRAHWQLHWTKMWSTLICNQTRITRMWNMSKHRFVDHMNRIALSTNNRVSDFGTSVTSAKSAEHADRHPLAQKRTAFTRRWICLWRRVWVCWVRYGNQYSLPLQVLQRVSGLKIVERRNLRQLSWIARKKQLEYRYFNHSVASNLSIFWGLNAVTHRRSQWMQEFL